MKYALLSLIVIMWLPACHSSKNDEVNKGFVELENNADSIAAIIKKETNEAADTFYKVSKEVQQQTKQ